MVDLLERYSNLCELQRELKGLYNELERQPRVKRRAPVAMHIHKIEMRLGMRRSSRSWPTIEKASPQPS
jgi:hypothetical protein